MFRRPRHSIRIGAEAAFSRRDEVQSEMSGCAEVALAVGEIASHCSVTRANDTTSTLPADLNHFSILDKHRHAACTAVESLHPCIGRRIRFYIVFKKVAPAPLQPLAKFSRVGTMIRAVEFKRRHDSRPP